MEYVYPCNSCSNKEKTQKRPPLKRGQLKLQIARTLGSLVVPGAKNSFRRFIAPWICCFGGRPRFLGHLVVHE
ncbi:hypothetical protein BRADI_2g54224v3 [Brachypodium distachyon]|uniref:Uncharacterized protein n=1 Tax=Brachypodium distachyon TaxID=15368 RepID=A0A2K2DFS7_BRADI|nr:hypothetical protein BRADI_2g54224v3 [Brachypodium distachyon]